MKETKFSRIKDKRMDVKVSPAAYDRLVEVRTMLEEVQPAENWSMSDAVLLMYKWSGPAITEIRANGEKMKELTMKKPSQLWIK